MLDYLSEDWDEARWRETVDSLAELQSFEHHRGDDRVEPQPFSEDAAGGPASPRLAFQRPHLSASSPGALLTTLPHEMRPDTEPTTSRFHVLSRASASDPSNGAEASGTTNEERAA